jgi:hypothetical protein
VGAPTALKVDVDAPPEFEVFMGASWPRSLAKLKALSEELA